MHDTNEYLDHLLIHRSLPLEGYEALINGMTEELRERAAMEARLISERIFQKQIYVRGLIEFSNVCINDCYYCGLRKSKTVHRYRLSTEDILDACQVGWDLGYRTFVLQSGDDPWFTDERIRDIVSLIRARFPDAAITLSVGERSSQAYRAWFEAGANRYLLRHESADSEHYASLHPDNMRLESRLTCLQELKAIGYQVGCGFMVGSPGQTARHLARDLKFIEEFDPAMVGIGPFLPSVGTPFALEESGSLELTLFLLSLLRIQKPERLLPATTAIGSLHPLGREMALDAGANVLMPNISPTEVRKDYALYDGKICIEDKAADCQHCLSKRVASRGYELISSRGDYRASISGDIERDNIHV